MTRAEQQYNVLKAKVALALYSEYGRVPKEREIDGVYHLTRVIYGTVLGTHFLPKQQQKTRQLVLFYWQKDSQMLIGYARVSTQDQTLHLQTDALKAAGCDPDHIYTDTITGVKADRPGLREAQSHLRAGDTLVVWRLDRLGRTLKQLVELINDLNARGIGFKNLTESIDTTTSGGKLVFHIFGALAEFEREVIKERTIAGLQAARARGRLGGRPKLADVDPKKIERARKLYHETGMSPKEICETLQISKTTLYRYVA